MRIRSRLQPMTRALLRPMAIPDAAHGGPGGSASGRGRWQPRRCGTGTDPQRGLWPGALRPAGRLLGVEGPELVGPGVDRIGDEPFWGQVIVSEQVSGMPRLKGHEPELAAVLRHPIPSEGRFLRRQYLYFHAGGGIRNADVRKRLRV